MPVLAAVLDLVEFGLHVRRKADVHDLGEVLDQHVGDAVCDLGGLHVLTLLLHILSFVEHGDDGRVRRRTPDALVLHRLDEGGVRIADGGLGELLLGLDALAVERVPFPDGGQKTLALLLVAGLAVLPDGGIAREFERLAARLERIVAVGDLRLHGIVQRLRHLRGDEALVDELIDIVVFFIEQFFDRLRRAGKIDGTDRLVRVLRALLGGVDVGLGGKVLLAVRCHDVLARRRLRIGRDAGGVSTDIGDERDVPHALDVDALIEVLRHEHGLGRSHAELVGGVLLERARREGRGRVRLGDALFDGRHLVRSRRERGERRVGLFLAPDLALLSLVLFQRRLEGGELLLPILQFRRDRPVLLRLERLDLPLALDDEPQCNRLHTPRREPVADLIVQKRRELVAHKAVEHAARLLRVDEVIVDRARRLQGMADRLGRNFIELDAVLAVLGKPQHRLQVPADRLALAVRVGCKIYPVGVRRFVGEALDDRLLPRGIDVAGFIIFIGRDAELLLRQVADMSARGVHPIFPLQVAGDGFRLARRLNDDEIHISPCGTTSLFSIPLYCGKSVPARAHGKPLHLKGRKDRLRLKDGEPHALCEHCRVQFTRLF